MKKRSDKKNTGYRVDNINKIIRKRRNNGNEPII